jgi:hypothetical protein
LRSERNTDNKRKRKKKEGWYDLFYLREQWERERGEEGGRE